MRDAGLCHAIDAAGGVAQLARKIGVAQPSVSNWSRVPTQRVIAVEAATGVSRQQLRPDLYGELPVEDHPIDPVDAARAREYALLAALLSCPPSSALLSEITKLRGDATLLGLARAALADAASKAVSGAVEREYFGLFVGLGRGELLPYASYYLTGFLNEKPLAELRETLAGLGIARADHVKEPEDHIAALCEVMAGLIDGSYGMPQALSVQRSFFETHMAPWVGRFFADLEGAEAAAFYAAVGMLGRRFVEIESAAFAMDV